MCGICGLAQDDAARPVERSLLERMCAVMAYRGPDDEGYHVEGAVGLGMRRLAVIDVLEGRQPMRNEDGTIRLVFNGEIYNYRELAGGLERRGHTFSTRSDTEVIVHAYEEFGEDFVLRLRGMFAIALWDSKAEKLLLAVDRFGIKPLYYAELKDSLVFGSEIKCIIASGRAPLDLDMDGLAQYFTLGYVPGPHSAFSAVRKVLPGHMLRWRAESGAAVHAYWDVPECDATETTPTRQVLAELKELLGDAVRSHLISDVPLGAFLSGGVDSSSIVALMSEVGAGPVKTFSIGFADPEHNELQAARLVAQRFGTDHTEYIVEPESVEILSTLAAHFDEPFADSSALPTYFVSRMARDKVKVVLSGDGGDELFLGYTTFQGVELARQLQRLPPGARRLLDSLSDRMPRIGPPSWRDRVGRLRKRIADSLLPMDEAYLSKIVPVGLGPVWGMLSDEFRRELDTRDPFLGATECLARRPSGDSDQPLDRFVYAGIKLALAGDMLVKVDRMSMANSLEVRVPFLDHVLAEFVVRLPISQRFPRWRLKALLRDAMSDRLPREILGRRKHGFTIPAARWFREDVGGFAAEVLLGSESRAAGFFDSRAIEAQLEEHRIGERNISGSIWALLMFELWRRQAKTAGSTQAARIVDGRSS